jgi:hypothetical protein
VLAHWGRGAFDTAVAILVIPVGDAFSLANRLAGVSLPIGPKRLSRTRLRPRLVLPG